MSPGGGIFLVAREGVFLGRQEGIFLVARRVFFWSPGGGFGGSVFRVFFEINSRNEWAEKNEIKTGLGSGK